MTAAAGVQVLPKWVLLESYVFRGDDDNSFPDETVAPIRASGTTSWGAGFRIAFSLANPPSISCLYAQLPGFPGPYEEDPLRMVATHRHLALLVVATKMPSEGLLQNLFIFKADENNPYSSSLRALPPCTEHRYDFRGDHRRRRRRPSKAAATPRLLDSLSSGLWCGGDNKFVVAELTLYVPTDGRIRTEAFADICLLRSSTDDDHQLKWDTMRVPILSTTDDDLWKLSHWQIDAVTPFQRWLCWIDYQQGILFCDVSSEKVTISFLWFPPDRYYSPITSAIKPACSGNGRVSIVDHGRLLKFVYVARHDGGPFYGALKPGTGFTITCHTLLLPVSGSGSSSSSSSMAWKEDYTVTSDDLPDRFQQGGGLPMFPQVDIDRPQLVHFLFVEFGKAYGKMSVLSIDMNKKTVESCYLYVDGNEPLQFQTEDAHFIADKCLSPTPSPFLPCEFPSFCHLSRKRKDME